MKTLRMKNHCYLFIALILFTFSVKGQTYYQIPYQTTIPASTTIGGNTIQINGFNSPSFNNTACNLSILYNWIGGGVTNDYSYQFTLPVSDIRLEIQDIEQGEAVKIYFNNQLYTILTSDISSFSGTCNLQTTYDINNGALTTFSSNARNARLDINPGFSVFDVKIEGVGQSGYNGVLYDIYFVNDTCYFPFNATANTPCAGGTLQLSVDTIPGVSQYDWVKSSTAVSSMRQPQLGNIQPADAGTYFVTATRGNCQYTSSVNATINTSPSPLVNTTINNGPLCPGNTLQLSTGTVAGVTYVWNGPDNFSSTQQNPAKPNINSLAEGRYYVRTISTTNGCTSAPDSTDLILYYPTAPPVASGSTLVCRGTNIQLNASPIPSGATYEWKGPNGFYSTQQNPLRTNVTYADSGDYYVVAKMNGCSSKPDTIHTSVKILTPSPGAAGNSPVCPGTNILLTAANIPNATYNWYGPAYSSTQQNPVIPNVTTAQAGDYFVAATVNGCVSDTEKVSIVVAILAATPDAGSDVTVCPGKSLQLTSNTLPNATYEWKGPNFISSDQNPLLPSVTSGHAGTYYLYAIVNGCKSLPDSTVVKVEITTPTPDGRSNSPICRGNELKLTAPDMQNATYAWIGPGNYQSATQNPVISQATTADTGYYVVTATIDGCTSLPDTVKVSFKPTPDIISSSSNTPVCEADSIVLTAKGFIHDDKVQYIWMGPEGYYTAPSHIAVRTGVTMNMAGKYSVFAVYDGCLSDTQSVDVTVKPKPIIPEITAPAAYKLRIGETLNISAGNIAAGADYRWTCPDGIERKDTAFSIEDVSKAAEGDYIFTVTFDGCSSEAKKNVAINDMEIFNLFPNPNNGSFTIKVGLQKDRDIPIQVINSIGQVIYQDASKTQRKLMMKTIDLGTNITNGLYVLRLGLDGKTKDLRFVILR